MHLKRIEELKSRGLAVMPLIPYSKNPLTKWDRLKTELYTGTFPEDCNIGIICGNISGKLFVIDIDEPSLYDEFKEYHDQTYIVQTGKRGFHIYLRATNDVPKNVKLDDPRGRHIDIKSEGGYVLSAGSIHPDTMKEYVVICDKPIMSLDTKVLREKLEKMGFQFKSQTNKDIEENGALEGSRNNAMFKYGCHLVRDVQLFGAPLKAKMMEVNEKNNPPLDEKEIDLIITQVVNYEGKNVKETKELISLDNFKADINLLGDNINIKRDLMKYVKVLGEDRVKDIVKDLAPNVKLDDSVVKVLMHDINPKLHEGIEINFDTTVMAVGQPETYTVEARTYCEKCGKEEIIQCDEFHKVNLPYCSKDRRNYKIDVDTRKTAYIQQMRIRELYETARYNTPVEFDAEISDENVGEAFMNDMITVKAKLRSIPPKDPTTAYNHIVLQIISMQKLEQKEGCMPSLDEIKKWKADPNTYKHVVDSIAPEIWLEDEIVESAMLCVTGGVSLNGKRARCHMGIIGDAQQGKSELYAFLHKMVIGSGLTIGKQTTGTGLTIGMHKMYNGTMVPMAGFFPSHTGKPVFLDEVDKMKPEDLDYGLECMEQGTASQAKTGSGSGIRYAADCTVFVAGNPKGGKYNPRLPSIIDNYNLSAPFLSRLDILWNLPDLNDEEHDEMVRQYIRAFDKSKYMSMEELQRYFVYTKTLKPVLPKELEPLIDALHKKMRPLNKKMGVPIGWRQFYGLNRLVTASAANHLREVVTEEDFKIVENIIFKSLKSMGMDIETGEVTQTMSKTKDNKERIFLETWKDCEFTDNTVSKDEFLKELAKKAPFYNDLNVGKAWVQYENSGKIQPQDGRYIMVIT